MFFDHDHFQTPYLKATDGLKQTKQKTVPND